MGYHLAGVAGKIPLSTVSTLAKFTLIQIADYADDRDHPETGGIRGANAFPSLNRLSLVIEKSPRTVQRALSELRDAGFIRERITSKFLRICGGKGPTQMPTCYEVNLAMIARLIDAKKIIDDNGYAWNDPHYTALLSEAARYRDTDWSQRTWNVGYRARELDWDGTVEGVSENLWNTVPDEEQKDTTEITDEEITEIANTYRIDTNVVSP